MSQIKFDVDKDTCSMGGKYCFYVVSWMSGECRKYKKRLRSNGKEYLRCSICKKENP